MGKISKKSKNKIEPRVWDSLHDLELMLNSFEKYDFGIVLGRNQLLNLYNEKCREVTDGVEKYVKKVNLSNLFFFF